MGDRGGKRLTELVAWRVRQSWLAQKGELEQVMAKPHLAHGFLGLRPLLTPDLEVFSRVFWRLKLRSPDRPISISDIAAYVDRISRTTDFELFVHLLSEMENAYHETLARFEDRHDDPRRRVN